MQYASWLLLVGFLAASIAGLLGFTLFGIGIAFVAGCTGGLVSGFLLSEVANLYEKWMDWISSKTDGKS
jgi:hypothetical protein